MVFDLTLGLDELTGRVIGFSARGVVRSGSAYQLTADFRGVAGVDNPSPVYRRWAGHNLLQAELRFYERKGSRRHLGIDLPETSNFGLVNKCPHLCQPCGCQWGTN